MEDRSFLTNNHPNGGVSDTFREYIEALVEEVVINGESFDAQKKWLRKNSEAEGISYETIESNLNDLFEAIKELGEHESKSTERFVRNLAQSCNFSETEVDKLFDNAAAVRAQKEAEKKVQKEKEQQAERIEKERLAAERKAKREAQKKAREKAEREAREERERIAKEEDERKVNEEAERIATQERERKAKEEAERKKRKRAEAERKAKEEAEQRAREEAQRREKEEAEEKAKEEAEQRRRHLVERNKKPVKIMTAVLVVVSLLEIVILKWWCILPLIINFFLGILTQENCKDGDFGYEKLILWGGIIVMACFFEALLGGWSLLLIPITLVLLVFVYFCVLDNDGFG